MTKNKTKPGHQVCQRSGIPANFTGDFINNQQGGNWLIHPYVPAAAITIRNLTSSGTGAMKFLQDVRCGWARRGLY
jgi:hypothetical protein